MREAKWLTVVLAVACLAGCSTDEAGADKRLSGKIEEARRLYAKASALLADPGNLDAATGLTYATAETVITKTGSKHAGLVTRSATGLTIRSLETNSWKACLNGGVFRPN